VNVSDLSSFSWFGHFGTGLLPIPAQTWDSKPSKGNANTTSAIFTASALKGVTLNLNVAEEGDPYGPANVTQRAPVKPVSQQWSQESRMETSEPDNLGQNEENDQNLELEEDEESVLIRRVGFVFLAYNVEFWCVEMFQSSSL
jgi:hypothetical protein